MAESEAKRARAEEELVTTAKLAAALEARLAAAQAQIDSLQLGVQVRGAAWWGCSAVGCTAGARSKAAVVLEYVALGALPAACSG